MVQPIERERNTKHLLEDRLAQKFDDLQLAREERVPHLFDEIGRSIEVLLRAVPQAYQELAFERQQLDAELEEAIYEIYRQASQAPDPIYRDAIVNNKSSAAEWEYREAYEEIIIDVLQKHGLVTMMRTARSQLETPFTQMQYQPEQEFQPQPEPVPQQQKPVVQAQQVQENKKPHLVSRKAKKEKFEV